MPRRYRPGLVLVLALIAITAAAYPEYAGRVSQTIRAERCEGVPACNRVTGVALPEVPSFADLFLHHPPSEPTR